MHYLILRFINFMPCLDLKVVLVILLNTHPHSGQRKQQGFEKVPHSNHDL
jgi:hypothetical protein